MADDFTPIKNSSSSSSASSGDDFSPLGTPTSPTNPQQVLNLGLPKSPVVQPGPQSLDPVLNKVIDFIRPFAGNAASAGATALTAPFLGPGAPVAGGASYTGVDMALKALKTDNNQSLGESVADSAKEALINEIGGRVLNGVFRGGFALRNSGVPDLYKLYPTTSQALENYGYHALGTAAKFSEDFGAASAKARALDKSGGEGFTQALQLSNAMNGRSVLVNADPEQLIGKIKSTLQDGLTPGVSNPPTGFQTKLHYASQDALDMLSGGKTPFQPLDDVIYNKDKLDKVLAIGQTVGPANLNVRKDLQAYQFMRMFNDATTKISPTEARIAPNILQKTWYKPENQDALTTLYGAGTKDNLDQFIKNVISTQDPQLGTSTLSKIKYLGGGFGLGGLLTQLTGAGPAGAIASGLYATNATMGRLLTNPKTARFVTAMAGSEPMTASKEYMAKAIFDGLQGSSIALLGPGQKKTWGTIERQGDGSYKFVEQQ